MSKFIQRMAAVGAAAILGCAGAAHADSINFGQFGVGSSISDGASGLTDGGVVFKIYSPGAGFAVLQQDVSWLGNFPNGTPVLFDNYLAGPVTIDFMTPISSITSLGVEANLFGPYTATLKAYNGVNLLGTSSFNAVSAFLPNTVSSFNFAAAGITSIVISTTHDGEGFGLGGSGGRGVYQGVPEPATWAIMLLGFGAVGGALRMSRRKASAALAA